MGDILRGFDVRDLGCADSGIPFMVMRPRLDDDCSDQRMNACNTTPLFSAFYDQKYFRQK